MNKMLDNENNQEGTEELDDNPFLSALAEPGTEEHEDAGENEDEGTASAEILKERLSARNKTIAKRDKAIERMQQELSELRQSSQVTPQLLQKVLEGRGNGRDEQQSGADDEIAQLREKFEADPSSIVQLMLERERGMEQRIADVLARRDAFLARQLKPAPAKEESRMIEALKQRAEFKGFTDEQLEIVAKTVKPIAQKASRPPAPAGGGGNVRVDAPFEELEKRYAKELEAMGYGDS